MPFDALTLSAVCRDLNDKLVGGRVQGLLMPGPLTLSLEVYRGGIGRTHLILSAHPQHARIHLSTAAPTRDPSQHPPLLLLLRKYVSGGTLVGVSQPMYERVLELSIAKRLPPDKRQEYHSEGDFRQSVDAHASADHAVDAAGDDLPVDDEDEEEWEESSFPVYTVTLVVELMGRLSNIVLVDEDGTVMDAVKRIPPSLNRYRTTLPHQPYTPPPPQDKRDPLRASINTLSMELSRAVEDDPAVPGWKALVAAYMAVSPPLAREVVFQAFGSTAVKADDLAGSPAPLATLLKKLQETFAGGLDDPRPVVAWRTQRAGDRQPVEFACYPLSHLERGDVRIEAYGSMSASASAYYAGLEELGGHSALRGQVRAQLEEMRGREERRLASLRQELVRAERLEELRRKGELILGYMHTLQPGQTILTIPEEGLTIDLDPSISPVENAQRYFREYRKARSAQAGLPAKVEQAERRLEYIDGLLTSLDLAATYDDIRAVQTEARAAGVATAQNAAERSKPSKGRSKGRKEAEKMPQPLRLRTSRGAQVLVGRTASQNDVATFRLAGPDDLWLHARGVPGSHVILRVAGDISPKDIEEAAAMAAAYSKLRNDAYVDVIYTERKYVRKIQDAPPGLVTYKNEKIIRVAPSKDAHPGSR